MALKAKNTAAKQRLIQEIGIVVVILVALGGFMIFNHIQSSKLTKPKLATPLDTTFDTNALNQVQTKDKTDPSVTPVQSELGKTDPFSK